MSLVCYEDLQGSEAPLPDVLLRCPAPPRLALKAAFLILADLVLGVAPTLHPHPVSELVAVLLMFGGYLSVALTGDESLQNGEPSIPVIDRRVPAPVINVFEPGGALGSKLSSPEEVPLSADPAPQVEAFLVMVLRNPRVTLTGDEALQGGQASVPVIGGRVPVPFVQGREPSSPVRREFPAPVDLPLSADPGAKTDAVFLITLRHAGMADSAYVRRQ
jgi:hypothetical protein